jgi:hypothetical protein
MTSLALVGEGSRQRETEMASRVWAKLTFVCENHFLSLVGVYCTAQIRLKEGHDIEMGSTDIPQLFHDIRCKFWKAKWQPCDQLSLHSESF